MRVKKIVLISGLALSMTGCATIIDGSTQDVGIGSDPQGAKIYIDDQYEGKTPSTVTLQRADVPILKLEKEGYETFESKMDSSMNGNIWWNLLLGGVIGAVVDHGSGASLKYPDDVTIPLQPIEKAVVKADDDPVGARELR